MLFPTCADFWDNVSVVKVVVTVLCSVVTNRLVILPARQVNHGFQQVDRYISLHCSL